MNLRTNCFLLFLMRKICPVVELFIVQTCIWNKLSSITRYHCSSLVSSTAEIYAKDPTQTLSNCISKMLILYAPQGENCVLLKCHCWQWDSGKITSPSDVRLEGRFALLGDDIRLAEDLCWDPGGPQLRAPPMNQHFLSKPELLSYRTLGIVPQAGVCSHLHRRVWKLIQLSLLPKPVFTQPGFEHKSCQSAHFFFPTIHAVLWTWTFKASFTQNASGRGCESTCDKDWL